MHKIYIEQNARNTKKCWAGCVKNMINNIGYSEIFNNIADGVSYHALFEERLHDQYIHNWRVGINST